MIRTFLVTLIVSFSLFTNCLAKDIYFQNELVRAVKLQKIGYLEEAIEIYNKLIKTGQAKETLYFNRGLALREIGDFRGAIRDFNRGLALNPNSDTLYFNRGVTYLKAGEYKKALQDFNRTIRLVPGDVKAIHNRAVVKYELFDLKGALEDAQKAEKYWKVLKDQQKAIEARELIEQINWDLNQNDYYHQ